MVYVNRNPNNFSCKYIHDCRNIKKFPLIFYVRKITYPDNIGFDGAESFNVIFNTNFLSALIIFLYRLFSSSSIWFDAIFFHYSQNLLLISSQKERYSFMSICRIIFQYIDNFFFNLLINNIPFLFVIQTAPAYS